MVPVIALDVGNMSENPEGHSVPVEPVMLCDGAVLNAVKTIVNKLTNVTAAINLPGFVLSFL